MITKAELETFLTDGDEIERIKDALTGKGGIVAAFHWEASPQGHQYWGRRYEYGLDDEARSILQEWVDVWEGRKSAGDEVLHR